MMRVAVVAGVAALLAGCASQPARMATPVASTLSDADRAHLHCLDRTDFELTSRGWPARPSPGTPQADARWAFYDACMRRLGHPPRTAD